MCRRHMQLLRKMESGRAGPRERRNQGTRWECRPASRNLTKVQTLANERYTFRRRARAHTFPTLDLRELLGGLPLPLGLRVSRTAKQRSNRLADSPKTRPTTSQLHLQLVRRDLPRLCQPSVSPKNAN